MGLVQDQPHLMFFLSERSETAPQLALQILHLRILYQQIPFIAQVMMAPKGTNARRASLKCCRPKGMPMMVM